MLTFLLAYYLLLNVLTFACMGWDKRRSVRKGKRIAEKTLLLLSIAGGFIGGFAGMNFFRHKTKHWYFRAVFIISIFVHIIIILFLEEKFGFVSPEKLL
ncbi:MAG: DUF1294 domain-containing protein [Dehalobacterium sp.]|jgi:uncharacterized membrane protein YsdA (DUF1294 family)